MSQTLIAAFAVVGIDIGKNSFHIVDHDERGAIALRQKWSRGQVEARFANMPPCLIGMEACVGAHHLSRKLRALGHDARLTRDFRCRPIFDFCNSIPPGADIRRPLRHVRFVPISAASHPSSYSGCRI